MVISLPVTHFGFPSYNYGIAYFWSIYLPVCGIFFHYRHYSEDGEGAYYLNLGYITVLVKKIINIFNRF